MAVSNIAALQGDKCTPPWYKCKPKFWGKGDDECCPGYECQEAPKGCKVGRYVCTPKFTPKCGEEGFPCGGKSGAVCCEGEWEDSCEGRAEVKGPGQGLWLDGGMVVCCEGGLKDI
jgi:hypothetical protein